MTAKDRFYCKCISKFLLFDLQHEKKNSLDVRHEKTDPVFILSDLNV